jgi:type VI secretion system FHA domain protein
VPTEKDYFKSPQVAETIPEDWSTEFGAGAAPAGSPPAAPQGAAGAPSHPAAAPVAFGPSDIASARAFLAGAGMEGLDVTDQELEQLMRTVGATFRQMVEGMREVLMTRTSIKSEFRIDQTMLKAKENNPLKFSTSGEEAMKALLHKPAAGYMPAERAVQEGFEDIRAHQLAVMAGLQVALTALLKRFDPETLAKRLEKSSLLSSKKAQYWDLFTKLYQEIAREAEDDFQSLFGREFSRAYKEQVKKL